MADDEPLPEEPKLPLTVDSPIAWAEFLIDHEALRAFYKDRNIHCFDCCAAEAETFAEGAKVHEGGPYGGFDAQKLVDGLNELAKQHPVKEADLQPRSLLRRVADLLFAGPKK
ncbi:MAG: hypothetical protein H6841_04040 [Planctomycetes bacterium]|nr:hypothetical protein [Planctomycetota bacterium]MCB9934547.1 hypothetical protein [Planctomycetota bacterium]